MKFRKYKKDTFKICMNYVRNQNEKTTRQLYIILRKWADSHDKYYTGAYDYEKDNVLERIEYCSDRMNKGRAEAILNIFGLEI